MNNFKFVATLAVALAVGVTSRGAFIIQVDTDGAVNAAVTFNPLVSLGTGTAPVSVSSAQSAAVGITTGNSIFGGAAVAPVPDTYRFSYTPGTNLNNLVLMAGQALNNNGSTATGLTTGASGLYNIYVTWPRSGNISGGPTNFALSDGTNSLLTNSYNPISGDGALETGGEWIYIGQAELDASTTYTLTQSSTSNTSVSMRSSGVLFDYVGPVVPEPSTMALLMLTVVGGIGLLRR